MRTDDENESKNHTGALRRFVCRNGSCSGRFSQLADCAVHRRGHWVVCSWAQPAALPPFFIAAVVCAALLAVLALYARRIPLQCGLRPAGTGLKTVRVLSAFLLLASAVLLLLTTDGVSLLTVLKSIFLVACSGACIVFAMGRSTQSKGLCTLFPLFFMCVYLLCFYRDTARNPLTYTFAFENFVRHLPRTGTLPVQLPVVWGKDVPALFSFLPWPRPWALPGLSLPLCSAAVFMSLTYLSALPTERWCLPCFCGSGQKFLKTPRPCPRSLKKIPSLWENNGQSDENLGC